MDANVLQSSTLAPVRPWTPTLTGSLRAEAEGAACGIADALLAAAPTTEATDNLEYGSLQSGVAGQAVLFAYLYLHTAEPRYRAAAETLLSLAADWIAAVPLRPQLYEGFVGVAWATHHVTQCLMSASVADSCDEIDDALIHYLGFPTRQPMQFDLLRGLAGVAVYALERLPRAGARRCLERILDHLEALAEHDEHGLAWRTYPEMLKMDELKYPAGNFNLGVAHGSPGVIAVLAQICRMRIDRERAGALLDGAVRSLLARRHLDRNPSRTPSFYYPGVPADHGRLAWCHGDPGVAITLLLAASCLNRSDWAIEALDAAESALEVRDSDFPPRDATLCHGAIGLAHIYNRLFQMCGDERMKDAVTAWVRQALTLRRPSGCGTAGFSSWRPLGDTEPIPWGWRDESGFLTGASGTALGLLAASSAVEPAWDRVLGLSSVALTT